MVKIGIICTIPNHLIEKYLNNKEIKQKAKTIYEDFIKNKNFNKSDIILVGNGHPWISHLPIEMYMSETNNQDSEKYSGLELYMCTGINIKSKIFMNTHEGRTLNIIHEKYKLFSNVDSLEQLTFISKEKITNKKIVIKRGFKQANTLMVRNCDYVLVFGLDENTDSEFLNKIHCNKQYFVLN